MANLEIKVRLMELGQYVSINGKSGVFIADDMDCVFVGKKDIYLTLTAIERKSPGEDGQTHFLKPSIPTDKFRSMTQEEKQAIPIVGQVRTMGRETIKPEPVAAASVEVLGDMPAL